MALASPATIETVADLLEQLHIPPARILLRPSPGEATEADLLKTPRLCELIDGVLVEKAMGYYESLLAAVLIEVLGAYVRKKRLGIVLGEGGLTRVRPSQVRMPDVAYFSWDKFPGKVLPRGQILDVAPDLAVEILSPTNTKKEMTRKRREYFAAGSRLVWQVDPDKRVVKVYTSPMQSATVDEEGTLDGGDVVSGFTLSVRTWFDMAGAREE